MDQMVSKVGKVMKKENLDNDLCPKCGKVDFFQKLWLALGLGLAIQFVEMATFDGPDGFQGWESDEKRIFGQRFVPKVCKKWTLSKARVSVKVRVRVRVSYSSCENGHFRWTRCCPRLGKWWKHKFLTTFWAQSVEELDFFQKLWLALGLGLGLGLAIHFVKIATFDGPDGSKFEKVMKKKFWTTF